VVRIFHPLLGDMCDRQFQIKIAKHTFAVTGWGNSGAIPGLCRNCKRFCQTKFASIAFVAGG
jgi:hypothetical protein